MHHVLVDSWPIGKIAVRATAFYSYKVMTSKDAPALLHCFQILKSNVPTGIDDFFTLFI